MTRRSSGEVPAAVQATAERRAAAREARDWAAADQLREEIEAAGWKVIDAGVSYRLEPAHPPDVVTGEAVRYGRSDVIPSLLGQPPTRTATAIVIAREDTEGATRAVRSLLAQPPDDLGIVIVADGLPDRFIGLLEAAIGPDDGDRVEIVRTSAPLGQAASLNAGVRRSSGRILVVVDPSIEVTGDVVSALVAALADPAVALAGPLGMASTDLRHFVETATASSATAIEGSLQAFRREDVASLGPFDEAFRFYRYLDVWWSLVLRDAVPERMPREARVIPGLPFVRHDRVAWTGTSTTERDRLSKRNFYRLLDQFRDRLDLAIEAG